MVRTMPGMPAVKWNPEINLVQLLGILGCVGSVVGGAIWTGIQYRDLTAQNDATVAKLTTLTETVVSRLAAIDQRSAAWIVRIEALEKAAQRHEESEKRLSRAETDLSAMRARLDASALVDSTQNQRIENLADSNGQMRAFIQDIGKAVASIATDVAVIKVRQEMGASASRQPRQNETR